MCPKSYTSAVDRLLAIPEVFTGADLTILFGWRSTMASSYLAHWRRAGLIKSLGGRSDVHMNLVRNRNTSPEGALRRVYPCAVKVGVDVVRQAGWTTQIPTTCEVAIPFGSTLHELEGFTLTLRRQKWFDSLAKNHALDVSTDGIDCLKPAWALVDMIVRARDRRVRGAWLLDPDDLDLQTVLLDKQLPKALLSFGLDPGLLQGSGYEDIYEAFTKRSSQSAERQHP